MKQSELSKRNITALHENSKILQRQISELRDELTHTKQSMEQLRTQLLQLHKQVLISATSTGGGPTHGSNS